MIINEHLPPAFVLSFMIVYNPMSYFYEPLDSPVLYSLLVTPPLSLLLLLLLLLLHRGRCKLSNCHASTPTI